MMDIVDYIKLPQSVRQEHLRLDEDCIIRGGQSMYLKGLLAHLRDTTIPSGRKVHVCHACHNELCSNPNHIYWGTPSENALDAVANGRKSIWECMVEKYGEKEARRMQGSTTRGRIGGKGNTGKPKSASHKAAIGKVISEQRCYTNGVDNIKQHKDLPIPNGYTPGMTRKKKCPTG